MTETSFKSELLSPLAKLVIELTQACVGQLSEDEKLEIEDFAWAHKLASEAPPMWMMDLLRKLSAG